MSRSVSFQLPFTPDRPDEARPFAALAAASRTRALWTGQGLNSDPMQCLAFLAGQGLRIPFGVGVGLMPFHHPVDAALRAMTLASATGQPVCVGYGVGGASLQSRVMGRPFPHPAAAAEEYLSIMSDLVHVGHTTVAGEHFSFRGGIGHRSKATVEVGAGVLRTAMARVAGRVADCAITWLATPEYLSNDLIPAMSEAAKDGRRPRPRCVAMVPVALDHKRDEPIGTVLHAVGSHLQMPHYRAMLDKSGVTNDRSTSTSAARALVEQGGFLLGDEATIWSGIRSFWDAGVDEVVLTPGAAMETGGADAALSELEALLRAKTPEPLRDGEDSVP